MIVLQYLLAGLCLNYVTSFIITQNSILPKYSHNRYSKASHAHTHSSSSLFAAGDLPTAYEWLAEEKELELEWLNPASVLDNDVEDENCDKEEDLHLNDSKIQIRMPLYPLEACYVPLSEEKIGERDYVILKNVEPQNVKMAFDLKRQMKEEGSARFCTVLRANDTGRIATVGTIMRIVDLDEQYLWDGTTLARIVLKCIPEERVEIINVLNPKAWSRENRLRRSDEYLTANVSTITSSSIDLEKSDGLNSEAMKILNEYEVIKRIYETDARASHDFPPFALEAISSLPHMDPIIDDESFWSAIHLWQKICFTVKEARRVNLQAIIHEKTISAAIEKGGPLNLPIHREDLPSNVRIELNQLESDAARDFIEIGIEPCLGIQHLLATRNFSDRIILFKEMVRAERIRLEINDD